MLFPPIPHWATNHASRHHSVSPVVISLTSDSPFLRFIACDLACWGLAGPTPWPPWQPPNLPAVPQNGHRHKFSILCQFLCPQIHWHSRRLARRGEAWGGQILFCLRGHAVPHKHNTPQAQQLWARWAQLQATDHAC